MTDEKIVPPRDFFVNHRILKSFYLNSDYSNWANETIGRRKTSKSKEFLEKSRYSKGRIEKEKTMVGLKTFWILISALFLLAACVPQTKQTECGKNEAFNASLRTCVPIVGGPSSFINVATYTPQFTQTRSKDDVTPLTFAITVSNPYNQSYSVEWERVYNAAPVSISGCGNVLSCSGSLSGAFLGNVLGQIGTHIITAKIKDGNGSVVDSQNFELKINDLPRPTINRATLTPASYAFDAYPTDAPIPFYFTVKHNNATFDATNGYKTTWTIQKNGAAIPSLEDIDLFTAFSPTGNTVTYFGDSPAINFAPSSLGVGSYIIRAVVSNSTPGEVVDEMQWNVNIKQPDLANVTNISLPAPGVTITSHHDVDYNDFTGPTPAISWYSGSIASPTQPNFCVTVDDRDGTYDDDTGLAYPADGPSIQVRFYLDSLGGDICTKKTLNTPGTQTICLIDSNPCIGTGAAFDTNLLKFSNSSPIVTQTHKVSARLFDEATTYEFQRSDVIPSNGSYPVEWNVLVKPTNVAPTLGFGTAATNPTGCVSAGAFTRSGCQVTQGTNFTVSFTVTDDFYSASSNGDQFQWDVQLKRNGNDIVSPPTVTSCSKAFLTAVPAYGTQYTCTLAVPHFIDSGPISPAAGPYQVVASLQDAGSPVGGAPMVSQSLTWNLVVTESNPSGVVLAAQVNNNTDSHISLTGSALDPASSASFATEGDTIGFNLGVTDAERDDFKYRISLCTINTPAPCASSTVLTSPAYVDYIRSVKADPDLNPVLFSGLLYTLPEDLLLQVTPIQDVDLVTSALVYFKVDVVDAPSTITGSTSSRVFQVYVRNKNPAPVINSAAAIPAVGSTTVVYSGMPLTIDPGTVTDVGPASETNILYQWYADVGGGFNAITGATSRLLRYTPGNISTNITLKMCVGDRPAANPVTSTGTCTGTWTITPKPYLYNLTATGIGQMRDNLAVWYDNFQTTPNTQVIYSAYTDDTFKVFVEKTIKNTAGNIVLSTQTIAMEALSTGTVTSISNLSITGTANSVYVAYIASPSTAPTTNVPRIRRISKFQTTSGTKTGLAHPDRFGFNYAHYGMSDTSGVVTTAVGDGAGGFATVTFTGQMSATQTITINGAVFTAVAVPSADLDMCSATCATANDSAEFFKDKLNASTDVRLQGLTAVNAGGGVVQIWGQYNNDYLDFDGSIAFVPAFVSATGGLGKIFIANGKWNLPFINSSLAGAEQNNISVLSADADVHMRTTASLNTTNDLTDMGKVAAFDAKINQAGQLVIAKISAELADAGALSIYRYQYTAPSWAIFNAVASPSATDQSDMDIFGLYSFEDVKLATDKTGNSNYYVIAKEKTSNGGEYHIGRYNIDLDTGVTPSENFLSSRLVTSDSTSTVINDVIMKFPVIESIPGVNEARIFFSSVGAGSTPYPRMARWRADNTVGCDTCSSLTGSLALRTSAPIGISQLADNITLGAAGATVNENIKDLIFPIFNVDNGGNQRPYLGVINAEAESIQSTTVDATGRWRPPFAK